MDEKKIPLSILDSDRKMYLKATFKGWGFGTQNMIGPRDYPKGIEIIQIEPDLAEIRMPSAIKYMWLLPYALIIPFYFFIAVPLTLAIFGGLMFGMRF